MRWDNLDILRAVDRLQDQSGGTPVWSRNGLQLAHEVAGVTSIQDRLLIGGFLQELEILREERYLTFETYRTPTGQEPSRSQGPEYYLQQLSKFALTVKGQDRARARVVVHEHADSAADDGRPISNSTLREIGNAIDSEHGSGDGVVFLGECGIPLGRFPTASASHSYDVLRGLADWGSEGKRVLREFIARWMNDEFSSGPDDVLRERLRRRLARQGWFPTNGLLIVGDRVVIQDQAPLDAKPDSLSLIIGVCRRFPELVRALRNRRIGRKPFVSIDDEYDVQDLLALVLRAIVDDVRVEENAPSRAGVRSRMDILLREFGVVIETKMTRSNLRQREVVQQLIIDRELYRDHPWCRTLIFFVYDPTGVLDNPKALEVDLTDPNSTPPTVALVIG